MGRLKHKEIRLEFGKHINLQLLTMHSIEFIPKITVTKMYFS